MVTPSYTDRLAAHAMDLDAAGHDAYGEAKGTATVASGTTSITVTHGVAVTPVAADVSVTPTNSPTNDPGHWWVSSVGATTFVINVRTDPGTGGATFAWAVRIV